MGVFQGAIVLKYQKIANEIQARINGDALAAGSPLPSERKLAEELGVAVGTVRLAYDLLHGQGVISRHRGKGTFVAGDESGGPEHMEAESSQSPRRFGLLLVDMNRTNSVYPQEIILEMAQACRDNDYELVVDFLDTDDLVSGQMPTMIRRHSVNGLFIYGYVQDHHVRYLEEQSLPFLLLGNRRISREVSQVSINVESLSHDLTLELLKMGRGPIWLDVDPANMDYEVGRQLLQGYTRAMQEQGRGSKPLHLCPVSLGRYESAASMLAETDLSRAACIMQDPTSSVMLATLAAKTKQFSQLMVVPMPYQTLIESMRGFEMLAWDQAVNARGLVVHAVSSMIEALTDGHAQPHSVHIELRCELKTTRPEPTMTLTQTPRRIPAATQQASSARRQATAPF